MRWTYPIEDNPQSTITWASSTDDAPVAPWYPTGTSDVKCSYCGCDLSMQYFVRWEDEGPVCMKCLDACGEN